MTNGVTNALCPPLPGLDTISSPTLGFPVLKDANSWMECTVTSRMEAGDHIVIYAQVGRRAYGSARIKMWLVF